MTGKRLSSRAQDIVSNFIEYFALEKENGGPLISLNGTERRVADALGVTRRTVSKIKHEKNDSASFPVRQNHDPIGKHRNQKTCLSLHICVMLTL
ncbi:hypothetical protein Zmor_011022 [Zophobas morio]|uniref:HTH psq-type domain-containing protein n=1 Tax=Zophobas morio TaxID=2755281 RepID=A0AA38MKK5_9CUCU|nr:hypothetical protein Zmor_011022 [Zophobas morio]